MTTAMPSGDPAMLPPRDRILQAASDLFNRYGIRSVGVDAIVERSGVAKATLYKHFPSKDGLVAEVLRLRDTAWRERFEGDVLGAGDDPVTRLLAVFDSLQRWFADPEFRGSPFINARVELVSEEHPGLEAAADHVRRVRRFLTGLAADAGVREPEWLAAQLQQVMKGAMVMSLEGEERAAELARGIGRVLLSQAGLALPTG